MAVEWVTIPDQYSNRYDVVLIHNDGSQGRLVHSGLSHSEAYGEAVRQLGVLSGQEGTRVCEVRMLRTDYFGVTSVSGRWSVRPTRNDDSSSLGSRGGQC